jgi:hypothetical protein
VLTLLIRSFGEVYMVSGLPEIMILLSFGSIVHSLRYNWIDVLLMSARIDDARWVPRGGIFDAEASLLAYIISQPELNGPNLYRATIKAYYVVLIWTNLYRYFSMTLITKGASLCFQKHPTYSFALVRIPVGTSFT